MKIFILSCLGCFLSLPLFAQLQPSAALLGEQWPAQWIAPPGINGREYGVFHFRKSVQLDSIPRHFVVAVSADNRYKLYVNGILVSLGPARGDLLHWNYELVDIAPRLRKGTNILTSVVWNFGQYSPEAQISKQTAFILQGNSPSEWIVNTDTSWRVLPDTAYAPLPFRERWYYVAGPGERFQAADYPWGWEQPGFNDNGWSLPAVISRGYPTDFWFPWDDNWGLQPCRIPPMLREREQPLLIRQWEGIEFGPDFANRLAHLIIPPHQKIRLLLDQTYLTKGYFRCRFSGGRGAGIRIRYAEGLFDPKTGSKGNRHRDIENKPFIGATDSIVADGGPNRVFETLWQRTWRYVEIQVETREDALVLEEALGIRSGYPFERKARFDSDSDEWPRMLDVGWRTAGLCADETYTDCPYYEQLQYTGDTRIQALVSLFNAGDDRLMRNAIIQLRQSLSADGILMSRYPTRTPQYIPPFALYWIGMVHDYRQYRDDPAFVREQLPAMRMVIDFFQKYRTADGVLGHVPHWNFADWVRGWPAGIAPTRKDGHSALLDLQFLIALDYAADLEAGLGHPFLAKSYQRQVENYRKTIHDQYWDASRGYFADTPDKMQFSQHTNALAVLAGLVDSTTAAKLMSRVLTDTTLAPCTIYFKYYLHRAAIAAGLGNAYADWLGEWRRQLANGLSTWGESPEPTRSDCHAWGAHPNIEIFRTVLGVDSDAPGFRRVRIEPHPGQLTRLSGVVPHPAGEIAVSGKKDATGKWNFTVALPAGVTGSFIFEGKQRPLKSGETRF